MFLEKSTDKNSKMLIEEKKTNKILILIFIQKISLKNMQDLLFFLHKNNFHFKKVTRKNKKKFLTSIFVNSNFILESEQNICGEQLKNITNFLNQYTKINGIFFENQILNYERISKFEKKSDFHFWKQIFQISI